MRLAPLISPLLPQRRKGALIQRILCDGRRGLDRLLAGVPTPLGHFHQVQAVSRYLICTPKSAVVGKLRELAPNLKNGMQAGFADALEAVVRTGYKAFINERNPLTGQVALHAQAPEKRLQQPEAQP